MKMKGLIMGFVFLISIVAATTGSLMVQEGISNTTDNNILEDVYPGPVTLGEVEMVFDWSVDRVEDTDIPDTPARAFVDSDGNVQLIASHYTNRRMVGNNLSTVSRKPEVILISDEDSSPENYNSREWIHSIYTFDGDTIYALVHNEYIGYLYGKGSSYLGTWYNSVTFARSDDKGETYIHETPPEHLVASIPYTYEQMEDSGPAGIFNPSNIIRSPKDGYYYSMLHLESYDLQDWGAGIMRTDDISDPTSWWAWNGTSYSADLINPYIDTSDPADHICAPVSRENISKMVSSVTYNTYFDKFLLVGMRNDGSGGRPDGIYYSLSDDLIHWTPDQLILECETWWNDDPTQNKHHYPSILDPNSTGLNFEFSGENAYLYYTVWHDDDPSTTLNRDLVRVPITFSNVSNYAPTRPNGMIPEDGEVGVNITPTMESSTYSDPDGDDHLSSQWQITNVSGNYTAPIFDSGSDTGALEQISVPENNSLEYSTTYYWRVRHQDDELAWSDWSKEISFTTMPPNDPPVQPDGTSPPNGTTGVGITDVSLESSVYSDPDGDSHAASQWMMTIKPGNHTDPVFDSGVDTVNLERITLSQDLELNTTYYWKVRHQDEHGSWSNWSQEIHFTTEEPTPPGAPVNLSATAKGSGGVELDWDDNPEPDVDHYSVYRSTSSGFSCNLSTFAANVSGRLNSNHTDSGLSGNTTYYYKVTAVDEAGSESPPSGEANATTGEDTTPSPPTDLMVGWQNISDVVLLDEDFSGSFPPDGWYQSGSQWQQSSSNAAGGTSPEAKFHYVDATGTWRLYAGPVDTTNTSTVHLRWDNWYEDWGGEGEKVTVKIQTSADGSTWNDTTWAHTSGDGDIGPGLQQMDISNSDVGSDTFYISFTIDGYAFDLENWYVDNVYLNYTMEDAEYNNVLNWNLSLDDGAGDFDVDHYKIYRSNNSDGPWDNNTLLTNVSAGISTYTDTDKGESDGITWWYVVRSVDFGGNEDNNTYSVSEPVNTSYEIQCVGTLSSSDADGWNFISFYLEANGDNYAKANDLVDILDDTEYGIQNNYDKAMYYDASIGRWSSYVPGRAGHFNNFATWDRTMGTWIHMTADDNLSVEGTAPTSTDITLYPGWNMVGVPSSTSDNHGLPTEVSKIGYFDVTQTYNVAYDYSPDVFVFEPGKGYWVYNEASEAVVWTVEY